MSKTYSISDIHNIFSPIPFEKNEIQHANQWIKKNHDRGNDLTIGHPQIGFTNDEILFTANLGYIFMTSSMQLNSSFLFLKLNAGTSLFGRQKAVYSCFHEGLVAVDAWEQGPIYKSWLIAITSIGNVYRGTGFR